MKKLITFRFDPDLMEQVRQTAQAENRTMTNFVETVLKRSVLQSQRDQKDQKPQPQRQTSQPDQ